MDNAFSINNGKVLFDGEFKNLNVRVEDDKIAEISSKPFKGKAIDGNGMFVIPGFIDVHIHGANAYDFCDGTREAFEAVASFLARHGVTGFLGTSMSYGEELLTRIFRSAQEYLQNQPECAAFMYGINMEGPFISRNKKGAQSGENIFEPDILMFKRLYEVSGESIKIVDVAPEISGGIDFIREASRIAAVSIAHTEADYETAKAAYKAGAKNLTHLFNAMPPFNHRSPGVIGAAMDYGEMAELICDGIHSHPAAVRGAFKLFGRDRICLISDAMRACGMPEGNYELGGQPVYVSADGKATLSNGTIAGSSTVLSECVRRAIVFGISPEDAIYCATKVPAKAAGVWNDTGSIEVGKYADIVLLDRDYNVKCTIARGKLVN